MIVALYYIYIYYTLYYIIVVVHGSYGFYMFGDGMIGFPTFGVFYKCVSYKWAKRSLRSTGQLENVTALIRWILIVIERKTFPDTP